MIWCFLFSAFPGWITSTCDVKHFEDLPVNARKYIHRIQEVLGVPVMWVSTGSHRDNLITV